MIIYHLYVEVKHGFIYQNMSPQKNAGTIVVMLHERHGVTVILRVPQLLYNKENIIVPYYGSLIRRIQRWPMDSTFNIQIINVYLPVAPFTDFNFKPIRYEVIASIIKCGIQLLILYLSFSLTSMVQTLKFRNGKVILSHNWPSMWFHAGIKVKPCQ